MAAGIHQQRQPFTTPFPTEEIELESIGPGGLADNVALNPASTARKTSSFQTSKISRLARSCFSNLSKCFCNASNCVPLTGCIVIAAGLIGASAYYLNLLAQRGGELPIGLFFVFSTIGILSCAMKNYLDAQMHLVDLEDERRSRALEANSRARRQNHVTV